MLSEIRWVGAVGVTQERGESNLMTDQNKPGKLKLGVTINFVAASQFQPVLFQLLYALSTQIALESGRKGQDQTTSERQALCALSRDSGEKVHNL